MKMDQEIFDYLKPESRRRQSSNLEGLLPTNLKNQHLPEVLLNALAANRSPANASGARVQTLSLVYPHRRRTDPYVAVDDQSMEHRGQLADSDCWLADTAL